MGRDPARTTCHLGYELRRSSDVGRSPSLSDEYIHLHGGTLRTSLPDEAAKILLGTPTVTT
jgi:hypothetical protein